ncbi:MAG: GH3 auxin-responsive promoter family protein [Muribaculaceae bacterium]|nr:GH3 auxin-responsive promoter family protein [Muribaculaceae bacterium]
MNLTSLLRPLFLGRVKKASAYASDPERVQRTELKRMLEAGSNTEWGRFHRYTLIDRYEYYREAVPVTPYEDIRPAVMRMIAGERHVLWPGLTRRFAQSSGTSDGKSKYIPITAEGLKRSHYRGASDVVSHYLSLYPDSRIFDGKSFILGGSFANELDLPVHSRVRVGDLSANLIDAITPLVRLVRVPSKKIALMADWTEKLPALAAAASQCAVTNISGVPSWFLGVLKEVLRQRGARYVHEVWPGLEVFFHGGISFAPYRKLYDEIIDPVRMRYMETYNASEGFFALQDMREPGAMLLLLDAGTFYEFADVSRPDAEPIPAWEVEQGKIYSLIITSCNGLWRYPIGDTVRIESVAPLRISIAGRTKHFINAFGEEVMVHNTDAALAKACQATGASVLNYTAAPVYATAHSRGRHQWLVEFEHEPADLDHFASVLDAALCSENSDYQAKRAGGIFLDCLTVTKARRGLFNDWLGSTGKLGGQRKVPRLSNDRALIERMLTFQNQ